MKCFPRSHFATCCASFDQLGVVAAQLPSMEQLFSAPGGVSTMRQQPAISQGLQYVRAQVEAGISDFTTWKTQVATLQEGNPGNVAEALPVVDPRREKG